MKVPKWLKGKQLSGEVLEELSIVQLPNCMLRDIPIRQLPDEWLSLRAAADCIYNMCFYGKRERNLQTALSIIAQVQADLQDAEGEIRVALERSKSGV